MKILALHLTNVRKFTAKRASITGIGAGITVVSEANEFGKSTFFDAIHALFFEKYSSSAKPVKSLQPYAGGAVEIAADVATDQGTFRVEKRFLSKKSARISRLPDGATLAQDDEAERWISSLLGTAHDGPAGLLWVRQGQLGLEANSPKETAQLMETRRDLLSSVAGEIDTMTGGRRMDRVMRGVAERLALITTKTGRQSGPWKAASDAVETLSTEFSHVSAQVKVLETALTDRKQAEAAVLRFDNPAAKTRRDAALVSAKAAMETARARVGAVKAAEQTHDLAVLRSRNATHDLDAFLKAIDTLETAQAQAADLHAKADDAQSEATRLKGILDAAQTCHAAAVQAAATARQRLDQSRRQSVARRAKTDVARINAQIVKAQTALAQHDAARAVIKASVATPDWLQRAEQAQADLSNLTATFAAQATTFAVAYDGPARITHNGVAVTADQRIVVEGDTRLVVPGLGAITIHARPSGDNIKSELATAQDNLDTLLSQPGATSIQDARSIAAERTSADAKAALAKAIVDTLAPHGVAALHTAKAEAELAAADANDMVLDPVAILETQVAHHDEAAADARQKLHTANADHAIARENAAKSHATSQAAKQIVDRAQADAGPAATRADRRAGYLRQQAQDQATQAHAHADLQTLVAAAPDLGTAGAELKRAEDAIATLRQDRSQVAERLAALSSEIRTLAGNGIEERRDELAGELDAARASQARFAQQAAALTRLQTALDAERTAARDTYFEPVQEELKPLLSILHRDAAISFDSDSLLPTSLMRDTTQETLDDLSGGTKEQIAILTRLAFARLFARKGRHMPIILDDALVYSDDDRIIKMFTALTRVAQDQQIIVFSCRQLAFQDLGGARPAVEITDI